MGSIRLHSLNDVKLVGRLTKDPELRFTPQGTPVCRFRIAVGRKYKDRTSGEWKEEVFCNRVLAPEWKELFSGNGFKLLQFDVLSRLKPASIDQSIYAPPFRDKSRDELSPLIIRVVGQRLG